MRCRRWACMAVAPAAVLLALAFPWVAAAKGDRRDLASKPLSPGAIALLLEHTHESGVLERIGSALSDPRSDVRAAAARAANVTGAKALAPTLAQALSRETDTSAAIEEIAALVMNDPSRDEQLLTEARRLGVAPWLSRALETVRTRHEKASAESPGGASNPGSGRDVLRLAGGYPPGYVMDTLALAGCRASSDSLFAATLEYGDGWWPIKVGVYKSRSDECTRAARALLASYFDLSFAADVPHSRATVVVPLYAEAQECRAVEYVDKPHAVTPSQSAGPGNIHEPRKIHNVEPRYPVAAKAAGIQGQVSLAAEISRDGCIRKASVVEAADDRLAVEALRTIAGWRYEPTMLHGTPVPVIMTVTMTFRLAR